MCIALCKSVRPVLEVSASMSTSLAGELSPRTGKPVKAELSLFLSSTYNCCLDVQMVRHVYPARTAVSDACSTKNDECSVSATQAIWLGLHVLRKPQFSSTELLITIGGWFISIIACIRLGDVLMIPFKVGLRRNANDQHRRMLTHCIMTQTATE